MDTMVLKTQEFLNAMYGHDSRYNVVEENGLTGWKTIYALTRALQIELGITETADSFGPTSQSLFSARFPMGVIQQEPDDDSPSNINAIIQGALWCKGYSTGASGITLNFYSGTGNAVIKLKTDAGLENPNSNVTLNVMAALLSMNQYVQISDGNSIIREIQQGLNRKYLDYIGLSPCDGLYGRDMNKALITALQAVEGYSVDEATGNFGDGTKDKLPLLPDTDGILSEQTREEATDLVKYALVCNGYNISLSNSEWDSELIQAIIEFQKDIAINQTGKVDVDTWMSLMISKGNPDRAAIACDTRFEMTDANIEKLKAQGYKIVGRYLTGTEFKVLRKGEPERIINAGMELFPIFQESTTDITYFTEERGVLDYFLATNAAYNFGIPEGSIIYFAVDLDAQNTDIRDYILPYFSGVASAVEKPYKIGVYGTRNVCTQVGNMNYAVASFVSNMSSGFSGNMGFKMPDNWSFDQFAEISIDADLDIDKDGYSGKFEVVKEIVYAINSLEEAYKLAEYYLELDGNGYIAIREVQNLYDENGKLFAYAIPFNDKNGVNAGHINVGARKNGLGFYLIDTIPYNYTNIKSKSDEGLNVRYVTPFIYYIDPDNNYFNRNQKDKGTINYEIIPSFTNNPLFFNQENANIMTKLLNLINKGEINSVTSKAEHIVAQLRSEADGQYYVKIQDNSGKYYYGGDQDWWRGYNSKIDMEDDYLVQRGCGPIAFANIVMYNVAKDYVKYKDLLKYTDETRRIPALIGTKENPEYTLENFNKNFNFNNSSKSIEKEEFVGLLDFYTDMFLLPNYWGTSGEDMEAAFRHLNFFTEFNHEESKPSSNSVRDVEDFIISNLNNDNPVFLINVFESRPWNDVNTKYLLNDKTQADSLGLYHTANFDNHWITITKFFQDGNTGKKFIAFSSWGVRISINTDLLITHQHYYSSFYSYRLIPNNE